MVLDYVDTLPADLLPLTVLDASATRRDTYRQWQEGRGGVVLLKRAEKAYGPLSIKVYRHGHGQDSFTGRKGQLLCQLIARTVDGIDANEEVLIIGLLPKRGRYDVEQSIRRMIKTPQERLHYITWGRHDATNDYAHIRHVVLAGVLNRPDSYHESLGRLCYGLPAAVGPYPDRDMAAIIPGEYRHLILQALCRGSARLCDGDECQPCTAYIIASEQSGIRRDLPLIFPGCSVEEWEPTRRPLRGKPLLAITYLREQLALDRDQIRFSEVQSAIGVPDAANFKRLRRNQAFARELDQLGLSEGRDSSGMAAFVTAPRAVP